MGANSLDVFKYIVEINPQIDEIGLQQYETISRQHIEQKTIWITRDRFLRTNEVQELIDKLPETVQMVVFSKVLLNDGNYAHIPMMDFDTPKNDDGLNIVIDRFKKVNIHEGWILESGVSYHFYGSKLLTESNWINFMGECLLTSIVHDNYNIEQVVDNRYIGHSLIRGGNTLRITTKAEKTFEPKVIKFIKL